MAVWSIFIFQSEFRQFEDMILKLVFGKECTWTLELFHISFGSIDVELVTFKGFELIHKKWQCGPLLFSKVNLSNLRT